MYQDTEEKSAMRDSLLRDSIGSPSKDQSSKYHVADEFTSEKKNSTIKEASASILEETIAVSTEMQDRMMNSRAISNREEVWTRPSST